MGGRTRRVVTVTDDEVAQAMRDNPWTRDVNFDWDEPSKVIRCACPPLAGMR